MTAFAARPGAGYPPTEDVVTEIPEHLLKRAAERRAAMSGGTAPADQPAAVAPVGDAPADVEAAKPAKAPTPLPTLDPAVVKPVEIPAVVAAAKRRKRVPFWAAGVLALLPLWGLLYINSMQPPAAAENDPLAIGAEVYTTAGCAGCHGPSGAGGAAGQKLNEGHVIETFSDPLAMVHWIAYGSQNGGARADGSYGTTTVRKKLTGGMPGWADRLTPEEIAAVTIYVRESLSGGDPADDPNFNAETFQADPAALEATVQAVIDLGPGGDVDTSGVAGAETEG